MNVLLILQGPPYGDERAYNGARLAGNLAKREEVNVRTFCSGDAVGCAVTPQKVPAGSYHLDRMLVPAAHHRAEIGLGGSCVDARGFTEAILISQAHRSTLDVAADWTVRADKTITF